MEVSSHRLNLLLNDIICLFFLAVPQIVFDEKELRREISHAIKNVHGVRQVETETKTKNTSCPQETHTELNRCLFSVMTWITPLPSFFASPPSKLLLYYNSRIFIKTCCQTKSTNSVCSAVCEYFLCPAHCSSNPLISSLQHHPLLFCFCPLKHLIIIAFCVTFIYLCPLRFFLLSCVPHWFCSLSHVSFVTAFNYFHTLPSLALNL